MRRELTMIAALGLIASTGRPALADGPVEGSVRVGQHDDVTRIVIETKGPVTFTENIAADGRHVGITASEPVALAVPKHVNAPMVAMSPGGPADGGKVLALEFKDSMRVVHSFQYPPQESYGYRMILDLAPGPAGTGPAAGQAVVAEAPKPAPVETPKPDWKPVATPAEPVPTPKPAQVTEKASPAPVERSTVVPDKHPPPVTVAASPPPTPSPSAPPPPAAGQDPTKLPPIGPIPGVETKIVPTESTFYPSVVGAKPITKPAQPLPGDAGNAPIQTATAAALAPQKPIPPSGTLNGPPTGRVEILPGFHAARFGADQNEVMHALTADFGQSMSTLTMTSNPTTPDRGIVIGVKARMPGVGATDISYAFEQQTRLLSRIDLEWGRDHQGGLAPQEAEVIASPIELELRRAGFVPVKTDPPDPLPGGKITFYAADPAGHLALLAIEPIGTVPPKGPPPRSIVRLSLVDARQPERLKSY